MEKENPPRPSQPPASTTEQVLGTNVGQSNVDPRWEKAYQTLTRWRESLLARRQDLLDQAAAETTPSQVNLAERATDEYDRDWALSMASSEQELLYEIDQALSRIRNGTYGICEATGQLISPERLEAIPWTRFSAEAEKQLEAEGEASRVRLGDVKQAAPSE